MDNIKIDNGNVKMIAHRGLSGLECENSCAAFIAAGVRSYYGIETDIHLTKDKKWIVCHDHNIKRVTGVDMVIEDHTLSELRTFPLVSPRYGEKRSDLVFPVLEDYISICKKYDKQAILEIKSGFKPDNVTDFVGIVKSLGWFEKTTFISFNREVLENIRHLFAKADIQYLTGDANEDTLSFCEKINAGLDIAYSSLSKDFVKTCHNRGIKVNCWTPDTVKDGEKLIGYGVDFITSNFLE